MPHNSITSGHTISEVVPFLKKYGLYACAGLTCYIAGVNLWLPVILFIAMVFDSIVGYLSALMKHGDPTSHELIYGFGAKLVSYTIIIGSAFLLGSAVSSTYGVPFNDWTVLLSDEHTWNVILSAVGLGEVGMDDFINAGMILIMVGELKSVIANTNIVLGSRKTKEYDLFIDMFHKIFQFVRNLIDRKPKDESRQADDKSEPIV